MQHINGQTRCLERLRDTFSQLQMIFHEKNTHRRLPIVTVIVSVCGSGVYRQTASCEAQKRLISLEWRIESQLKGL
ncbi:hypothetical protein ALP71_03350 [Pseudomonas coronafaciens pv. garcae]|nr:hypothetical protein ALP71_03350 [Pseudomonas coronafaciens pv. garcae]